MTKTQTCHLSMDIIWHVLYINNIFVTIFIELYIQFWTMILCDCSFIVICTVWFNIYCMSFWEYFITGLVWNTVHYLTPVISHYRGNKGMAYWGQRSWGRLLSTPPHLMWLRSLQNLLAGCLQVHAKKKSYLQNPTSFK